jgi:hypothetical protein
MSIDSVVSEVRGALYQQNLDRHYAIEPVPATTVAGLFYVALRMHNTETNAPQDIFHVYPEPRVAIHLYESWDTESLFMDCPWNRRIVLARSALRQHGYAIAKKLFKHVQDDEVLRALQVFDDAAKKSI